MTRHDTLNDTELQYMLDQPVVDRVVGRVCFGKGRSSTVTIYLPDRKSTVLLLIKIINNNVVGPHNRHSICRVSTYLCSYVVVHRNVM